MNPSLKHPSSARLVAFADGKLSGNELSDVEQHVLQCDDCATTVNVQHVYEELCKLAPEKRITALERECKDDTALRQRVEELLAAHDESDSFLVQSPPAFEATNVAKPGAVISARYTLREKIGEGGMGEVWVAKQTEPVKRRVALKLIKTGMDSKSVLARFDQERQALSLMDHPNIARVLDAGMTASGQPFFVMELVNGLPLGKFCDEAKLSLQQRLELFVPICQAVQHAHQKGIVHRDLKPANVLVTMVDGEPVPKVIDFGVAKAFGGKLADETITKFGVVVGTLEYMSPEQAGFSWDDIDTRSDIYSLGVMLYELLTGLRPFDKVRLRKAALTEMIRIIREEEPSKPSTRLSTDASLPSLAAVRQSNPKKLMAMLRGELDWVVMKCLEKNRDRRYETANGLLRDIQRYLSDEPVEARPPSTSYRLSKFLKRNKGPAVAAALVLLTLVAGITGTTWGLMAEAERAEGEKQAKIDAQRQTVKAKAAVKKEIAAKQQAQKRLAQIKKGNEILGSIFADLDPSAEEKEGKTLRVLLGERLDQATEQLKGEAVGDPLAVAQLQNTLGMSQLGLGYPEKAILLFTKARATRTVELGPQHADTLTSMDDLAAAYLAAGKLDQALPLFEETLKLRKAKLGPEHSDTLTSMSNLAEVYHEAGKLDQALPLFEETLKLSKAKLGSEHPGTLTSMNNLAAVYKNAGKLDQALPLFEETLKLRKAKLGPQHTSTLNSMNNLAVAYAEAGKPDQALPLYEETLKLSKAKLGPEHPSTLNTMINLASAYMATGKLDQALPLLEKTLKLTRAKLGPQHPSTLHSMNNLAAAYRAAGKLDQALPLYEETLKLNKAKLGPEHPRSLASMGNLAALFWSMKNLERSIPLFEETLKRQRSNLGQDHPSTLRTKANLGVNYRDAGRLDEAIPLFEQVHQKGRKHASLRWVTGTLLDAYVKAGKTADAKALIKEMILTARKDLPADSPRLQECLHFTLRLCLSCKPGKQPRRTSASA